MFLPVLSSILGIIAFNTQFYFMAFIALTPIFLFFFKEDKFWRLISGTVLFRIIISFGTVYFIIDPFLYALSILIFLGLPISIYLIKRYLPSYTLYFSLPILWTFWDFLEGQYTLLPMMISVFGNALADSPFLGLAKFGGVIGLTLFITVINLIFSIGLKARRDKRTLFILIISAAIIIIGGYWVSNIYLEKNRNEYTNKNNKLNVALMSASKVRNGFDDYLLSQNISEDIDLFFAPEGLYPDYLENYQQAINTYSEAARELEVALAVVTSRVDSSVEGKNLYKSAILFSKDGEIKDIYNKAHRTITSEYWPLGDWRPFYFNSYFKTATPDQKKRAIFDKNYQYEKGAPKLLEGSGYSFTSPICLEVHYPFYMKKLSLLGADFISHNSNNDWIDMGLNQYIKMTNKLRKIEAVRLQKPILVNGIGDYAGIISPDGTFSYKSSKEGIVIFEGEVRY